MDYSVDNAKSVFDLIRTVSPYAYPLLISLVFPIIWITLKKFMGLSNVDESEVKPSRNKFKDLIPSLVLKGDRVDKFVFYSAIALFFIGGMALKYGETQEEKLRQKALSLKQIAQNYCMLEMSETWLAQKGFTGPIIRDIVFKYPNDFISMDSLTTCVDSTTRKVVLGKVHPLLEAYLTNSFAEKDTVCIDDLCLYNEVTSNVEAMFTEEILYSFLSLPENKHKYQLRAKDGMDYLVENRPVMIAKREGEGKE